MKDRVYKQRKSKIDKEDLLLEEWNWQNSSFGVVDDIKNAKEEY